MTVPTRPARVPVPRVLLSRAMLPAGIVPLAATLAIASGCLLGTAATASARASGPVGGTRGLGGGTAMPATGTPDLAAEWWLDSLGVLGVWKDSGSSRPGTGATVAVLSTGVDAAHPDLTGSVTTGPDLSRSGASLGDQYWGFEGTAVASLIAGHGHGHGAGGTEGITGVAPGARILSLRVTLEFNDPRNSDAGLTRGLPDAIAAGIRYAVSHGASVIALPLDPGTLGMAMAGNPAASGGSTAEKAAVAAALAAGVVLVAPAGDDAGGTGTVNYPAGYPGVIAVGATDQYGQLESFSSTRPYVALTAPGGGVTVAAPGDGYDTIKTTDMSAALTAGVAALIRARYPRLPATLVARAIEHGTAPEAAEVTGAGTGAGALSASRALMTAAAIAASQPAPTPSATLPTAGQSPGKGAAPGASGSATGTASGVPGSAGSPSARGAKTGMGGAARSVLRDAAIGAGALIAALIGLLLLAWSRLRRARARRPVHDPAGSGRSPAGRVPAGRAQAGRRTTGGFQAITGPLQALSSHGAHAAPRGSRPATTGGQPALGGGRPHGADARTTRAHAAVAAGARASGGAAPRSSPVTRTGTLGSMGRPPIRADRPYDSVPREPARMPTGSPPADPDPQRSMMRPPWEPASRAMAAAPVQDDIPDDESQVRNTHSGPMYVWNPATNSGPLPAGSGKGPTSEDAGGKDATDD